MNKVSGPAILLLAALGLAPIIGGRIWFEPQFSDGLVSFSSIFLQRTEAAWPQFILAGLVFISVAWVALRRSVLQVPSPRVLAPLFLTWFFIALAVMASSHKHASLLEFARWTCYFFAMLAATATLGRGKGTTHAVVAIVLGASVCALTGISEFIDASRTAPNWRIFAGWQNPNAAAGMFAITLPVAIALMMTQSERTQRLLASMTVVLLSTALWLTASKGGLLAAAVGIGVLALSTLAHRTNSLRSWLPVAATLVCSAIFCVGISKVASMSSGTSIMAGSRLSATSTESTQSVAFRKRLWSDTLQLIAAEPVTGSGPGAYQTAIRKVSETQGSAVAHNGFLQFAAENGIFAAVTLLLSFVVWAQFVLRRHKGIPDTHNLLRCGVIGAVTAGLADSIVESSFSYFGWALLMFALLAIGLLLAVDGVMPERAPLGSRILGMAVVSVSALAYIGIGTFADTQSRIGLDALSQGDGRTAESALKSAQQIAPADPVPPTQLARLYQAIGDPSRSLEEARIAVTLSPTAQRYAILAEAYAKESKSPEARDAFEQGAKLEPHNPAPLRKLFDYLVVIGNVDAPKTAQQLVAMENKDFFKLKAIPWIVSTDTVGGRQFLADLAEKKGNKREAAQLLEGAATILRDYRSKVIPELTRLTGLQSLVDARAELLKSLGHEPSDAELAAKLSMTEGALDQWIAERKAFRIAGESLDEADEKTGDLEGILLKLASLYRTLGEASRAATLEAEARSFK